METNYFAIALAHLDIYIKLMTDTGAGIVAYEVYLGEKQNAPLLKKRSFICDEYESQERNLNWILENVLCFPGVDSGLLILEIEKATYDFITLGK